MPIKYFRISFELKQMSDYLDVVQNSLGQHYESVEARFENQFTEDISDDETSMLIDEHTDAMIDAGRTFPRLLLLSFIPLWYSFIEKKLINICSELDLKITITATDNVNFGKGIRKARKFLIKAKDYEIDKDHWQELANIGKLRNQIAHNGKYLSTYYYRKPDGKYVTYEDDDGRVYYIVLEEALFSYIRKHNMIDVSRIPAEIAPTFAYCKHLVDFAGDLLRKLEDDLALSSM